MIKSYEKYKDSGIEWIGEIPYNWKVTSIKRILNFHNNLRIPIESSERFLKQGIYPYYGASGIVDYIDEYIFNGSYILIGEDGANILSRSTPLSFMARGKFWVNNHAHILSVKEGRNEFFCHQIELNDFTSIASGSAQPKLTKEVIANLAVVVPSENEQNQIVKFLDYQTGIIDELIAKKERLIDLLKEKRQAVINEAVTKGLDPNAKMKDSGIEWLGEVPEGWEVVKLKFVADTSFSSVDRHEYEEENRVKICHYPYVYKNERINNEIELASGTCSNIELENFSLKKGQIIITKDSESANDIGVPAYVEEDIPNAVCGYHLAIIEPKIQNSKVLPEYLFRYFQTSYVNTYFELKANGVTRFGLGKPSIENLDIILPSLDLQKCIIKVVNQTITKINYSSKAVHLQIEKLKEYRQSIISEAVTGKIDVREWEPPNKNNA